MLELLEKEPEVSMLSAYQLGWKATFRDDRSQMLTPFVGPNQLPTPTLQTHFDRVQKGVGVRQTQSLQERIPTPPWPSSWRCQYSTVKRVKS